MINGIKNGCIFEFFDPKDKMSHFIGIRKYGPRFNKKLAKKYFLGGHMSALGYKNFADMVIKYTDESNPDEFAQVGFIGKGGVHNVHEKW